MQSLSSQAIRELVATYRAVAYAIRLQGGVRVVLRVGEAAPAELNEALAPIAGSSAEHAGFITAWNPFSQSVASGENRRRQRELLPLLQSRSRLVLAGAGHGPGWREPSLAAFGIALENLDVLARRFGQNAILAFRSGEPVRLRLYRDDWREALTGADVDFAE